MMTAQEMWAAYSRKAQIDDDFDAWAFGDDPDELAWLVSKGIKTATSSAFALYEAEAEDLPRQGAFSVILNSRDEAACIIRNTKVYVTEFQLVDERHARLEGEGDRSLSYWRDVHEAFFRKELATAGMPFDPSIKVVCEEFIRVYP